MKNSLTKGLNRLIAAGTLGLVFTTSVGAADLNDNNPPDALKTGSPTTVALVKPSTILPFAMPPAPPESIIPVNGQIIPWTSNAVSPASGGSLSYIRSGLDHFNENAPGVPIVLEINSPGGAVTTAKSILLAMEMSKNPVNTRCVGFAASAGAFMLMSGDYREAWSSCNLMIHNVQISGDSGGGQRAAVDIIKQNKEQNAQLEEMLKDGVKIVTRSTGMPEEIATAILSQDCDMPLDAAKALNVIDKIIDPFDSNVNERKFVATADNVCTAVHFSDDLVKKMNKFIAAPKAPRP